MAKLFHALRGGFVLFRLVLPLNAEIVEGNATDSDKNVDSKVLWLVVRWNEDERQADDQENDWNQNVNFDWSGEIRSEGKEIESLDDRVQFLNSLRMPHP